MRISGAGCCLVDSIYMNCLYSSSGFAPYWSRERGDGGLIEGGLVFREDLERFSGKPFAYILNSLTSGRSPDIINLGGPAIIALVHASQILAQDGDEVFFYGAIGDDENGDIIQGKLSSVPIQAFIKRIEGEPTSTTDVFDDPHSRGGKGERSFINTVGSASSFSEKDLPDSFYDSDIILLGGTALMPGLHDASHIILEKAKRRGCITVVGTVYDFRNEKAHPDKPWTLGDHCSYQYIDILVCDQEEALRLSGKNEIFDAAHTLISFGIGSLIITRGALDILVWSKGELLEAQELKSFPVSAYMDDMMKKDPSLRKDTTGCGDNFMGGVLISLTTQLKRGKKKGLDIIDLCAWGAASGGLTCTYHGGMFTEKHPGEKGAYLEPAVRAYKESLGVE